jgi:coiled-coil domain-containing protein 6
LERALEAEQEAIVNKLTKQTSGLRVEKDSLRHEREELRRQVESLLSDKIRLHREKVQLENTLEQEEENIVNRLQTQMLELYRRNQILQRRLEQASGSQTPSVVSESDASEDEGGWGHLSGKTRKVGKPRGGASVYAPSGHAPWERDMYASVSRRRSQGSASVSSAGTGGGRGGAMTAEREKKNPRGDEPSNPGSLPGSHPSIRPESARDVRVSGGGAMSVGGSSATTTPRSSVANTPLTTPRSAKSDRGANPDVVASPKNRAAR